MVYRLRAVIPLAGDPAFVIGGRTLGNFLVSPFGPSNEQYFSLTYDGAGNEIRRQQVCSIAAGALPGGRATMFVLLPCLYFADLLLWLLCWTLVQALMMHVVHDRMPCMPVAASTCVSPQLAPMLLLLLHVGIMSLQDVSKLTPTA